MRPLFRPALRVHPCDLLRACKTGTGSRPGLSVFELTPDDSQWAGDHAQWQGTLDGLFPRQPACPRQGADVGLTVKIRVDPLDHAVRRKPLHAVRASRPSSGSMRGCGANRSSTLLVANSPKAGVAARGREIHRAGIRTDEQVGESQQRGRLDRLRSQALIMRAPAVRCDQARARPACSPARRSGTPCRACGGAMASRNVDHCARGQSFSGFEAPSAITVQGRHVHCEARVDRRRGPAGSFRSGSVEASGTLICASSARSQSIGYTSL